MADPIIRVKRSTVQGKIPTSEQLDLGELAINHYDGKLFIRKEGVGIGTTVIVTNPWSVGTGTITYDTYFTSGNVGIGTTNPTSKLHVGGDVRVTGVVTASSFSGSGINLTGIVTSIVAGTGITVSGSTGQVTINSTGGGGGGESYWVSTSAGIHTLSNVGIGTTNPQTRLQVIGNVNVSGTTTSSEFVGGGSDLRNLSGTHLVSYASHSETSNSALSIAGINTYTQVGILTGSLASQAADQFGYSVATSADGKTIVVGAISDELSGTGNYGLAYVFDRVGNSFNQVGILTGSLASQAADKFGHSVATSADGKTIVVGAIDDEIGATEDVGVVYVFDRVGNSFNQVGILTGSLASQTGDEFGTSLATSADGRTIVVGATNDFGDPNFGNVYVFDRIGNSFNQVGILTGSYNTNGSFGTSLATSADGNTIIVGSTFSIVDESSSAVGAVHIFDRVDNTFNEVKVLYDEDGYYFGHSVATSADAKTIIVGSLESNTPSALGKVFVYNRQEDTFNKVGIFTGSLASQSIDWFGWSVTTSADAKTIIVGVRNDEIGAPTSTGIAYVYDLVSETYVYSGPTGNIGIGTTNPTSKLQVIGDVNVSGVVTASSFSGNATSATYSSIAGIATYATSSGVSTNVIGGIASVTQLNVSGISTLGFVTSGNIFSTGIITATSFSGSGTNLTGIVTSIVAGTNVTVSGSTGEVTINSTGGGGSISIVDDTATNDTFYVGIASTTTGNLANLNVSSSKLTFNPSTGNLVAGGTVTANSDEKLKTNVKTLENALDKVLNLRGVEFDRVDTGEHQIGVIAQEVEKVVPDVVYPKGPAPDYETKSVAYANLVGLLIEAIKEQNLRIEYLEAQLQGLTGG